MNKNSLLKQLLKMEKDYVRLFSMEFENEGITTYIDSKIPDMYTHNFTLYESAKGLLENINKEIEKSETMEKGFFKLETSFSIGKELFENLPIQPQVTTYDLMYIETRRFSELKGNSDCFIVKAANNQVLEDGINIDIIANQADMGLDFAKRRINRKAEIYRNADNNLELFVCYCDETPIGNIEYMPKNKIAKLEDFDIIKAYQRQGFGTSVLKHLLENAYRNKIDIAYLITDIADSAKEMYKKNGCTKIGEKTEMLFFLK